MAMGRIYTVSFEEVAVTAAQDLFEINAPADSVVEILEISLGQSTEEGDAQDEMLALLAHLGSTSGSGGTAPTARPWELGSAAFGGTVEVNNPTQSTEGTFLFADAWNVRAGFYREWAPGEGIVISPSDRFILEQQTAPADSVTMSGYIKFREIGG